MTVLRACCAAWLLLVTTGSVSWGDCAGQTHVEGGSSNGLWRLEVEITKPHEPASFRLFERDKQVNSGRLTVAGHHLKAFVDDAGKSFVLCDTYEGISIHDASGTLVRRYAGDDLLSYRERGTRPHKWGCHPEGTWLAPHGQIHYRADGAAIFVETHQGNIVEIDARTGEVARPPVNRGRLLFAGASFILLAGMLLGAGGFLWTMLRKSSALQTNMAP